LKFRGSSFLFRAVNLSAFDAFPQLLFAARIVGRRHPAGVADNCSARTLATPQTPELTSQPSARKRETRVFSCLTHDSREQFNQ
jgi:hypothetical protein